MSTKTTFLALALSLMMVLAVVSLAAASPAYTVYADVVRGSKNATDTSCVLTNVFKLGEQVVWRVDIINNETGEFVDVAEAERLGLKVVATVEGVGDYAMSIGPHPRQAPQVHFYAGAWEIPAIYRTGTFKWYVTVSDTAGNTQLYEPVGNRRPEMSGSWLVVERR